MLDLQVSCMIQGFRYSKIPCPFWNQYGACCFSLRFCQDFPLRYLSVCLSIYLFLEGSYWAHALYDLSWPVQWTNCMSWTHTVLRKSCTPVAGALDDGEELCLELSAAQQNISTFKLALESLRCYILLHSMIIHKYINNPPNNLHSRNYLV